MNKKKVSFKREWNKLTAGVWDYNSQAIFDIVCHLDEKKKH